MFRYVRVLQLTQPKSNKELYLNFHYQTTEIGTDSSDSSLESDSGPFWPPIIQQKERWLLIDMQHMICSGYSLPISFKASGSARYPSDKD